MLAWTIWLSPIYIAVCPVLMSMSPGCRVSIDGFESAIFVKPFLDRTSTILPVENWGFVVKYPASVNAPAINDEQSKLPHWSVQSGSSFHLCQPLVLAS